MKAILAILCILSMVGCATVQQGPETDPAKLTAKERARRAAESANHGSKPYKYTWIEDKGDYRVYGEAIVVP
jgi:hypothetical protein